MIGSNDLLHPSPAPHFKTFQVFLIYCPKRPSFTTIWSYAPNVALTIGTTIFKSKKLFLHSFYTFCPHRVFVCSVWIAEQTAIIPQCSINWLVCITETECVYCAVRTECIYICTFRPHSVFMFISVINQLDAQNFCFTISLYHASTCFEHMCSKRVEAWYKLL